MRIITTLDDLDEALAECDRAARVSDDELRRVFQTFRLELPVRLPKDPFSLEYANAQMALYERVSGRRYSTRNEETIFDPEAAIVRPFPYTSSSQVAGAHLGAIAFLLRNIKLRAGARVLDVGPGWGNTTLELAKLGFEVTALDIEPRFCQLIRERADRAAVQVEIVNDDFFWIERVRQRFDAIVFFESFHHCADHLRLLRALGPALASGGLVYFGAEPITPELPVHWGLRTDGESLWAIRRHGWLELGFRPDYFDRALWQCGFSAVVHTSSDLPWIHLWEAKPTVSKAGKTASADQKRATRSTSQENSAIPVNYAADRLTLEKLRTSIRDMLTKARRRATSVLTRHPNLAALIRRLLSITRLRKVELSAGDRAFIAEIYRGLLGRGPDQADIRHFGEMLRNGSLDRIGLINAIVSSKEFAKRLAEATQRGEQSSIGVPPVM
jgi:2-polyprenyl-3-methyl-5-hydroxy-6-metoxy-1,4-benzoquinol methylase